MLVIYVYVQLKLLLISLQFVMINWELRIIFFFKLLMAETLLASKFVNIILIESLLLMLTYSNI